MADKQTYTYFVQGGTYEDEKKVRHPKGSVFTSTDPLLPAKFPGSIVPHDRAAADRQAAQTADLAAAAQADKRAKLDQADALAAGETVDVTKDYPAARENALTVKQDPDGGLWVYDGQDDDPVNSTPLASKDVADCCTTYIAGDDEDE